MSRRRLTFAFAALVAAIAVGAVLRPSFVPFVGDNGAGAADAGDVARHQAELLLGLEEQDLEVRYDGIVAAASGEWADRLGGERESVIASMRGATGDLGGRIDSVGVADRGKHEQTVLVAASTLSGEGLRNGAVTRTYYFVMTLEREDGPWTVSSVEVAR